MSRLRDWLLGPDPRPRVACKAAIVGLLAGGVSWLTGLMLPWMLALYTLPIGVLLMLALMLSGHRWRRLAWGMAACWALMVVVVGYTGLTEALLCRITEDDGPVRADVIVVLSASTCGDRIRPEALYNVLTGVTLLRRGVAPEIVFTGDPNGSGNRLHLLGPSLLAALHADTGGVVPFEPVRAWRIHTYEEALSLRAMAERHGWQRILIVTSTAHTRRAKAIFRHVGLDAYVTPSISPYTADIGLNWPTYRFEQFHRVVYESAAIVYYHWRGRM